MENLDTPTLKRRLGAFLYEAIVLFGVGAAAEAMLLFVLVGMALVPIKEISTSSQYVLIQQAWLFLALGWYFVYFWRKAGQTLPMQTWRIRLVSTDGLQRVSLSKAICRYLLSWLWLLPGWGIGHLLDAGFGITAVLIALNIAAWASTARFTPDGQFLHDRLLGTRLVNVPAPATAVRPA